MLPLYSKVMTSDFFFECQLCIIEIVNLEEILPSDMYYTLVLN